ncbi:MAG TPA: hypothetical protein VKZ39_01155, partial [Sphaerochaetaceae bacterium]|nr:hypothetical protein [Sphaerochaetaceae bacterium]
VSSVFQSFQALEKNACRFLVTDVTYYSTHACILFSCKSICQVLIGTRENFFGLEGVSKMGYDKYSAVSLM